MPHGTQSNLDAAAAARQIGERLGARATSLELAVVLGSGLGETAAALQSGCSVPYSEIPGCTVPSVAGHSGELHVGILGGTRTCLLAGRLHAYEGHSQAQTVHIVRILAALGVRNLLICNAAGGINPQFEPGSVVLVYDHINLTWRNPLTGPPLPGEQRFPDMSAPYSRRLSAMLREAALQSQIPLFDGVYAGVMGPSYETRAEIQMLKRLGADLVGMSTVSDIIAARALGMRCAVLSCVTNRAAGLSSEPLSHDEVLRAAGIAAKSLTRLVTAFAALLRDGEREEELRIVKPA